MILLLGGSGQVGTALQGKLGEIWAPSHSELDILDFVKVKLAIQSTEPDWVINCAAYHKVDEAESNPQKAFQVNSWAVLYLAKCCKEYGANLVHFSTNYIFDGLKETRYREDDLPNPLSVYGKSKYAGELALRAVNPNYILVRTTGIYGLGHSAKGGNFILTMLRLADRKEIKVVRDQFVSPTYAKHLVDALIPLMEKERWGIWNITGSKGVSWKNFAIMIFRQAIRRGLVETAPRVRGVTSEQYGAAAPRPKNGLLSMRRLGRNKASAAPPNYYKGLMEYLDELKETGYAN